MGEKRGSVEGNFYMRRILPFLGLRPWKRHSTILMVAGILYTLVGVQYILANPSRGRSLALKVILDVAPISFWGVIFASAGILASVSSRWPPFAETWGYMVLTGLSAAWSATYLLGILFYHSPITNVTQVILWGLLAFMWWAISGLVNPGTPTVTSDDGN
jgi:ascorbate-specific PTS system EIIC-type component UlaA